MKTRQWTGFNIPYWFFKSYLMLALFQEAFMNFAKANIHDYIPQIK
jgi:hypothetical protein